MAIVIINYSMANIPAAEAAMVSEGIPLKYLSAIVPDSSSVTKKPLNCQGTESVQRILFERYEVVS